MVAKFPVGIISSEEKKHIYIHIFHIITCKILNGVPAMPHDVFISYSSIDKAVADAVCHLLEDRKIRCWIAPRDVPPGMPYARALVEAIGDAKAMVLIFWLFAVSCG